MKLRFVRDNAGEYPIKELCEALEVAPSAYHASRTGKPSARAVEDEALKREILEIHDRAKGRYGHRLVYGHLRERCGRDRTLRLMRSLEIAGKQVRRYRPLGTDSRHDYGYSPNRLKEKGLPNRCDEVWVADTTYLKISCGWMYLATVMDLYSRRIVGWSLSGRNDSQLVCRALENAHHTRGTMKAWIIHHSDRGSTYASDDYQKLLSQLRMQPSMSAKGNCYDNAAMESFYGRFKTSTIQDRVLADENEARATVFEYIEPFYNRYRKHSSLDYRSPVEFEQMNFPSPPSGGEGNEDGQAVFTQN
jgi:transposase InsO family protein